MSNKLCLEEQEAWLKWQLARKMVESAMADRGVLHASESDAFNDAYAVWVAALNALNVSLANPMTAMEDGDGLSG